AYDTKTAAVNTAWLKLLDPESELPTRLILLALPLSGATLLVLGVQVTDHGIGAARPALPARSRTRAAARSETDERFIGWSPFHLVYPDCHSRALNGPGQQGDLPWMGANCTTSRFARSRHVPQN